MTDPSEQPIIETPHPEVARPSVTARVPGAPRDNYTRMPTGPVSVEPFVTSGPGDTLTGPTQAWTPSGQTGAQPTVQWAPEPEETTRLAPWALVAAVVALVASWFVGWGIPLAIIAVIAAIMSLRRPVENRSIAVWALVLGIVATIFSAGWLVWAAVQLELL